MGEIEVQSQDAQIAVAANLVAAVEALMGFNEVGPSADNTIGETTSSNIFVVCQTHTASIQPLVHL